MRPWIQALLALAVLGGSVLTASWLASRREAVVPEPPPVVPPLVSVVVAEPRTERLEVGTHGTARALEETQLVSEVPGRVLKLHPGLVAGGTIEAGEVLLRLDPRDLEELRAQAAAAVAGAELQLALEERQARVARREWEATGDGEPDPLVLRSPQVARARADLAAARARLERAERDLERAEPSLPFRVRVREESLSVGDWVAAATPLATLLRCDVLEVDLPLSEAQLGQLDPEAVGRLLVGAPGVDLPVELVGRLAGREHLWRGRVVRAQGELDPRTRMLVLVARVDEPLVAVGNGERPSPLLPGLFLEARIEGREVQGAVRLPRAALGGPDRVLVVDAEDRLRFRSVVTAWQGRDEVVIESGLAGGERVVVSPVALPVDGMRVRVEEAP